MISALRIVLSISLLVLVGWNVDWEAILNLSARARWESVFIIVFLVVVERLLSSYRWYSLLRIAGINVGYIEVTKLVYSTTFVGFFLPVGGGAEVLRVFGLGRATKDVPQAVASIIIERAIAVIALGLLTAVGLALARALVPVDIIVLTVAAIGVVGLILGALLHDRSQQLVIAALKRTPLSGVLRQAENTFGALRVYRAHPRALATSFLVGMLFQFSRILQVAVGAWGLNLAIPFWQIMAFMPAIIFLTLLPISIAAGLGVREAAFVFFFGLTGVEPFAAFTLSLYVYLISFATGLPGAYLYARRGFRINLEASSNAPDGE